MNKGAKIAIGILVLAGAGFLTYHFFFKKRGGAGRNATVGGDDSSEIVYDKQSRVIQIQ